jgi:23S rRNA (uracil1939-C5)-methyltransferase
MPTIGDELLLTVQDFALPDGYGVARHDGRVIFIPGAFPGDVVRARIRKVDRRLAYADVVEIARPSPDRTASECGRVDRCGGCELQGLDYGRQLNIKENHLRQVLRRIGGIDPDGLSVSPIVPSVDKFYYRSKIEFSFGDRDGKTVLGLTERVSPLRSFDGHIEDVDDCRLFSPALDSILPVVRGFITRSGLKSYDPARGRGCLRRLVVREAKETKEVMVNIVAEADVEVFSDICKELPSMVPEVRSVYVTYQGRPRLAFGNAYITECLGPLSLRVYPLSFFQPNPRTAATLYDAIPSMASLTGNDEILGLYCGAGSLELFLAPFVRTVTGVDSSGFSIACASENSAINSIKNAAFVTAKAESATRYARRNRPDVVLIDPPRAGMTREAISVVKEIRARKVIYISCNPSTLARDLKALRSYYHPREIAPFDFFPHTGHFEVLACLERR